MKVLPYPFGQLDAKKLSAYRSALTSADTVAGLRIGEVLNGDPVIGCGFTVHANRLRDRHIRTIHNFAECVPDSIGFIISVCDGIVTLSTIMKR